ncbi:hypothetical protein D3OALGB2SA_3552 [Olavius algarvensis associated proteobacterium Delta 3]|nr:hypothetical protein D3OALGB2SA_3552 [Olavius algarvensis associated proteobacterium Delta 3]
MKTSGRRTFSATHRKPVLATAACLYRSTIRFGIQRVCSPMISPHRPLSGLRR